MVPTFSLAVPYVGMVIMVVLQVDNMQCKLLVYIPSLLLLKTTFTHSHIDSRPSTFRDIEVSLAARLAHQNAKKGAGKCQN